MRRHVSIVTVVGLASALLAGTTGGASAGEANPASRLVGQSFEARAEAGQETRRTGEAAQLLSATATFSAANRATGMPTSTAPQHQFAPIAGGGSISVTVDYGYEWDTGALSYHYNLETDVLAPDRNTSYLLGFGAFTGNSCTIQEAAQTVGYGSLTSVHLYDSKDTDDLASAASWDCAVLLADAGPGSVPYDAFVSRLDVVTATPQLSAQAPKRDRLVKRVWTRIPVEVTNSSPEGLDARAVAVAAAAAGKGIKVRSAEVGRLEAGDSAEADVWVRLTKPRATLRLAVTENGETVTTRAVRLRQRPAPARPSAGTWSGKNVDFTVRGGKVRGFRVRAVTTCGGYPDVPTVTTTQYSFLTSSIPRNNEVVATEKGNQGSNAEYTAYLELEFTGRTKAVGTFRYFGPANCRAVHTFTAKRRG